MWIDQIRSRVREDKRLTNDDIQESISQALTEYSGYYPNEQVYNITCDNSLAYSLPTEWIRGFSQINSIEYPITEELVVSNPNGYSIPAFRETSDYIISDEKLYLLFDVSQDDIVRIRYIIPYTSDDLTDIPVHHEGAILNLSTSYTLAKLASIFAQTTDHSFSAEAVDYKDRSTEYLKLTTWYRNRWEQVMGFGSYANDDNVFDIGTEPAPSVYLKKFDVEARYQHRMFRPSYEKPGGSYVTRTI
jgi:hypothetical protein